MRTFRSMHFVVGVFVAIAFLSIAVEAQRGLRVRIGTLVPDGSLWDETIHVMAQEWSRISDGAVRVQVFAGGVLGLSLIHI